MRPWTVQRGLLAGLLTLGVAGTANASPDESQTSETSASAVETGEPDPDKRAEYDRLVRDALQEYDLGHWEEARSLMLAAHGIAPSARTLRALGMVAFERREYVDAADLLERALDDERKPLTPTQRAAVLELLDRTRHFLGRYKLEVKPDETEQIQIEVDGGPARLDSSGRLVLEAGEHQLTVHADEVGSRSLLVDVRGGEEVTLVVKLDDRSEKPAGPAPAPTAEPAAPADSWGPRRTWGVALGATGVALAAVGGVMGGMAMGKAGSAETSNDGDADSARALALGADVVLAAGCAIALSGLTVWLMRGRDREARPAAAALAPQVARDSAGLLVSGRF